MGAKYREMVCDQHGIGGDGEYCGDNDAQLDDNRALPRGLEWQVCSPRGAFRPRARRDQRCNPKSPLGELFRPENLVNQNVGAGNNWAKAQYIKAGHKYC
jgi:tubulin beta